MKKISMQIWLANGTGTTSGSLTGTHNNISLTISTSIYTGEQVKNFDISLKRHSTIYVLCIWVPPSTRGKIKTTTGFFTTNLTMHVCMIMNTVWNYLQKYNTSTHQRPLVLSTVRTPSHINVLFEYLRSAIIWYVVLIPNVCFTNITQCVGPILAYAFHV